MAPFLREVPLEFIRHTLRNPRSDSTADLDGLAASIGDPDDPTLIQPPSVEQVSETEYLVRAGDRRIQAARMRGWKAITCLVYEEPLDLVEGQLMSLMENLHRRELHPLDEAAALKIAWLCANGDVLGHEDMVRAILAEEATPAQTLVKLQAAMEEAGFSPFAPAVKWDELLQRLGLDVDPDRRKRLLSVLAIDPAVQEQARTLDVSQATLRAIGRLDAGEQQRLVQEIQDNPELARKVRRIARVVEDGSYNLDEALAEARGEVYVPPEDDDGGGESVTREDNDAGGFALESDAPGGGLGDDEAGDQLSLDTTITDSVILLMDAVNQVEVALKSLYDALGKREVAELPAPWGEYTQDGINLLRDALNRFENR